MYMQNRSVFIDEANLARNIVEKDYSELCRSLDYQQYAPPLFLVLTKASTALFGINEFAIRLPSLLAGITTLVFMLLIANLLIEVDASRWYLLLILSFSILFLRYSTEFKQYAFDAALTLLFIYWALKSRTRDFNPSRAVQWALAGVLAIWFSMPIVFVLAAIGLAFLYNSIRGNRANLRFLLPIGATWLVSFGLYYYLILSGDATAVALLEYHDRFFFRLFPGSLEDFRRNWSIIESLFRMATDQTVVSIVWAIVSFVVGTVFLLRTDRFIAILLLTPVILSLITSGLKLYSIIDRLALFMIPAIMLVMGIGIAKLWQRSNTVLKGLMVLVMLLSIYNKKAYRYFWEPYELEDSKSVLNYLSTHRAEEDLLYVQADGMPAFIFYNEMHDNAWQFKNYYLADWREMPADVLPVIRDSSETHGFWLFLSHTYPQEHIDANINSARKIAKEKERFVALNASTYFFELK